MSEIVRDNPFERFSTWDARETFGNSKFESTASTEELVMICTEGFHSKNSLVLKLNGMESKDIELGKFSTKSFLDLSDFRVSTWKFQVESLQVVPFDIF